MKPETKAAIEAIYAEAEVKHGKIFRGAVDTLASVAAIYGHALDHCDQLAEETRIVGYSALDRMLVAGNLMHLKGEVCDFACRIVETAHRDDQKPDDAPPAAPFNINLH